jgi:diguanylate cyclase (GGDEF)-like protein
MTEDNPHRPNRDPLTGLPDRVEFLDQVRAALEDGDAGPMRLAVFVVGLDHFKMVNDALGHAAGDRLLETIAHRLAWALRPSDTLARLGGDEFLVLCHDVGAPDDARARAAEVTEQIARPVMLEEGEVFVTASIGIAIAGRGSTAAALVRDADHAMWRAKDQGRARSELFDGGTRVGAVDNLRTGSALRRALERREFAVYFQPIIDLERGGVTGFEALLRWRHPERGLVAPGEFIALAETTGLIVPIGAWVLEEACRQTARWQAAAAQTPPLSISVNLSPRQLAEPDLPEEVARIIDETGVHPDSVWLEITENTLMFDAESAIGVLRTLRAQGVHIAVDDFGTGYSSLSYLKRLPVEALKVDQTFIDGLGDDAEDTALATACVSLAHALGLQAIAEGVESPAQLAELRTLGCELAQGFLFAEPHPAPHLGERPLETLGTWAGLGTH